MDEVFRIYSCITGLNAHIISPLFSIFILYLNVMNSFHPLCANLGLPLILQTFT